MDCGFCIHIGIRQRGSEERKGEKEGRKGREKRKGEKEVRRKRRKENDGCILFANIHHFEFLRSQKNEKAIAIGLQHN